MGVLAVQCPLTIMCWRVRSDRWKIWIDWFLSWNLSNFSSVNADNLRSNDRIHVQIAYVHFLILCYLCCIYYLLKLTKLCSAASTCENFWCDHDLGGGDAAPERGGTHDWIRSQQAPTDKNTGHIEDRSANETNQFGCARAAFNLGSSDPTRPWPEVE